MLTGTQGEYLPQVLESGTTCCRRLAPWNKAGAGDRLCGVLLTKLRSARRLDWLRAVIESGTLGEVQKPTQPGRPDSKHHVHVDGQGSPLAVSLTGDRNDITQLIPLGAKIPSIAGLVGRPKRRPDKLLVVWGYDHDKCGRLVWA
ncbi:hypothetical protein [Streptomyces lavendulocolor]|uniref:hypothetical protein n=1 Tax=Streptomyces lavendulocolor TaxID=67316 RepID=UPI0034040B43